LAKLLSLLVTESRRERAPMAASKKTRRSSAKKATRKSASPQAGDVVYSDLRKIALARALARR
jgi:hypothetical protein